MDFDIFFSKYAKDNNHRNLITHSIIPSLILFLIGIVFLNIVFIVSGIAYLSHVIIDTFDWGTNLLYFPKKTIGLRFLISNDEERNLDSYLKEYKNPEAFFDFRYYGSKFSIIIEIILFVLMVLFFVLFAFDYILTSLIYFLGLYFHLSRHFHLKKIESSEDK